MARKQEKAKLGRAGELERGVDAELNKAPRSQQGRKDQAQHDSENCFHSFRVIRAKSNGN